MDDSNLQIKGLQVFAKENAPQNWWKYFWTNAWSVLRIKNWTINDWESNRLLLLNLSCKKFCINEVVFRQKKREEFQFLLGSWALTKVYVKKMFAYANVLFQEKKIKEKVRTLSLFWGLACNFAQGYHKDDRGWYVLALNKGKIQ